jgi:hypothetical protein
MTKSICSSSSGSSGHNSNHHHPFVYVRCPQNAWIPARILSTVTGPTGIPETAVVQLLPWHTGDSSSSASSEDIVSSNNSAEQQPQQRTVALDDYPNRSLPLQNLQGSDGTLRVVADLVDLPFLHEVRRKKDVNAPSKCSFALVHGF